MLGHIDTICELALLNNYRLDVRAIESSFFKLICHILYHHLFLKQIKISLDVSFWLKAAALQMLKNKNWKKKFTVNTGQVVFIEEI